MKSRRLTATSAGRGRLIACASFAAAAFVIGAVPSLASASTPSGKFPHLEGMKAAKFAQHAKRTGNVGTLGPAPREALRRGYLVPNPKRYDRQKARASRRADAREALAAPASVSPLAPSTTRKWNGIIDTNSAPPDETSAVGTTRYIELVNSKFAIYNKTGNAPINQGTLNALVGQPNGISVFDPQIMWDATTNRFYFATDLVANSTTNGIAYGFSKTATPSSAADWCKYSIDTSPAFYDYPKLGDSRFFAIIGANAFANSGGGGFVGSDLIALKKPGAGTGCPGLSLDNVGSPLKLSAGAGAFTPVPASEVDTNATGYVAARALSLPSTKLGVFKVTRNAGGNPVFQNPGTQMTVPSYNVPPPIPQKGTAFKIDSSDARNTQAQAAIDPSHGNKFALWTQHTVRGGAGAQVRWYEINPATHSLIQKGTVTSGSLYEFNGAIAPNRQVKGATKSGGNAMVMNFNTSSAATFPSIKMVSKVGAGAQSGQAAVFNGTRPLTGFDCTAPAPSPCRWGDYAAATPDPSTANRIWNVSQYGFGTAASTVATSRTYNFVARP